MSGLSPYPVRLWTNSWPTRRGWGGASEWVSTQGADFNHDFRVSFSEDEIARGRIDYNFGTIVADPRCLLIGTCPA